MGIVSIIAVLAIVAWFANCRTLGARSEPEMFGMIGMAGETFTDNVLEDEEE